MKDYLFFLKRFVSTPSTIGSIFPSSKILAKKMTQHAQNMETSSTRYLEIGAGSGALTKYILAKMQPGDTLDIVELDPRFCTILKKKYEHLQHVSIHQISILHFNAKQYDFIISSLPLNAFNSDFVAKIFAHLKTLIKPSGHLSYFEYIGLGKMKKNCLFGKKRDDFLSTLSLKQRFENSYCQEKNKIWLNFPPARIFHCQITN